METRHSIVNFLAFRKMYSSFDAIVHKHLYPPHMTCVLGNKDTSQNPQSVRASVVSVRLAVDIT